MDTTQELIQQLDAIAATGAEEFFTEDGKKELAVHDRKIQAIGKVIANWSEWDIPTVLECCISALEDSNAHDDAAVLQRSLDAILNPPVLTEEELSKFTGSQTLTRHNSLLRVTEGIMHLAERGECFWLLDAIASYQPRCNQDAGLRDFQLWVMNSSRKPVENCRKW